MRRERQWLATYLDDDDEDAERETTVPTVKKRIAVSLPPELEQALNELRDATGVAPSSFVAEIMVQSIPMIRGITEAALEAKRRPQEAIRLMQRSMMQALSDVASAQMELIDAETALRKTPKELPADKPARAKPKAAKGKDDAKPKRSRAAKAQ
ncbi:hypothetical protein BKN49_22510 [Pseudomonas aeruginosa]|nr:hypothetical protein BKN49_22510 [Pseudomonas aeruginosa]